MSVIMVSQAIADHPNIIVRDTPVKPCMSNLGLINGLVDRATGFRIAENWSDKKNLDGTFTFLGYIVVEKK